MVSVSYLKRDGDGACCGLYEIVSACSRKATGQSGRFFNFYKNKVAGALAPATTSSSTNYSGSWKRYPFPRTVTKP